MPDMNRNVAVIGAGSWGTTLAQLLAEKGMAVRLWVHDPGHLQAMQAERENRKYLPGIPLHAGIVLTGQLSDACQSATTVVMCVPSHVMREVARRMQPLVTSGAVVVSASKGIENNTLMRMSEVLVQVLGVSSERIACLYGPSHAEEVSRGIPTAVVAASVSLSTARKVRELFRTERFRVYSSTDIVGVELGGSLKNVIAIAAGICDGAGFGDNTKAALLTRGLAEMTRLGVRLGARKETFAGLSGMGDLIVTCTSRHSRNRHVGEAIGRGKSLQQVLGNMVMVAEGVKTTLSVHQLSQKYRVEMPIAEQVYRVLFENKPPAQAVHELMTREPKEEDLG